MYLIKNTYITYLNDAERFRFHISTIVENRYSSRKLSHKHAAERSLWIIRWRRKK